jgi:hypothetical protein
MSRDALTRADLLAVAPASAVDAIFSGVDGDRGTAELALMEQLRAGAVPRDALELTIVGWSSTLDGLPPGPLAPEHRVRLERTIAIQAGGLPALAAWLTALRPRITRAEDLDLALRFLLATRQAWILSDALRERALP